MKMFTIREHVVNNIDDLLPIFNANANVTATTLDMLCKSIHKLNRKMKMNNLTDFAICLCLFGTVSVVGGMLKQIDIQKQRIDLLEGEIQDLNNKIYTKDKDEEM